jgi:5-methylcytosine-specific restriction protein B
MVSEPASLREVSGPGSIEKAAWHVLGPGLRGDPSPFDRSLITWTAPAAAEMLRRVQDEPDQTKASFLVKLHRQLDGAPRAVGLLAAELLCVQVLPFSNVRPETKRERIATVLSCGAIGVKRILYLEPGY